MCHRKYGAGVLTAAEDKAMSREGDGEGIEERLKYHIPGENIPSPSLLDHPTISLIFLSVICSMRTNTGAISYVNLERW